MLVLLAEADVTPLMSPVIQYGFAGFAVVLLGVIVWMLKQWQPMHTEQLALQSETNKIIAANTATIDKMCAASGSQVELLQEVHDLLLSRPCMKGKGPTDQ